MKKIAFLLLLMFSFHFIVLAQKREGEGEKEKIQHHRIALFTGYILVSGAVTTEGSSKLIVTPTLGFDYEYYFSEKIALGLVNNIELDDYVVEDSEGELLERDYSFRLAIVFVYEPFEWWSVFCRRWL